MIIKKCSNCGKGERYKKSSLCYKCKYNRQQELRELKKKPKEIVVDFENEFWIDAPEFEGLYKISNLGRIKTMARFFVSAHGEGYPVFEKIIKYDLSNSGYFRATLSAISEGKKKRVSVHRIVCMAFHKEQYFDGAVVNHKDRNRLNNNEGNLEWCTQKHNVNHSKNMIKNEQ